MRPPTAPCSTPAWSGSSCRKLRGTEPDAVLAMDSLGARKTPKARELLDGSGLPWRHSPSCSPDLDPIEPARALAKAEPRRVAARDKDALRRALGPALDRVPAENAEGHFRRCGHERPDQPAVCARARKGSASLATADAPLNSSPNVPYQAPLP
jgi:hypothetical protein